MATFCQGLEFHTIMPCFFASHIEIPLRHLTSGASGLAQFEITCSAVLSKDPLLRLKRASYCVSSVPPIASQEAPTIENG